MNKSNSLQKPTTVILRTAKEIHNETDEAVFTFLQSCQEIALAVFYAMKCRMNKHK